MQSNTESAERKPTIEELSRLLVNQSRELAETIVAFRALPALIPGMENGVKPVLAPLDQLTANLFEIRGNLGVALKEFAEIRMRIRD